jgi:hypothetical protein
MKLINVFEIDELEPLLHDTLKNHHRVPVKYVDPNYIVFAGYKYTRTFTENTIPDCILSKLTMAKASGKKYISDSMVNQLNMYYYEHDDGMGDIAWRVSDTYYVVVLNERELRSLFGKEDDDTRSKSKNKSKENLR